MTQRKGKLVKLAKKMQQPKNDDSDDDYDGDGDEKENYGPKKSVIHQIHLEREKRNIKDRSDLEKNFKRQYFEQKKQINYSKLSLDRKSIKMIDERRKSMIDARNKQKQNNNNSNYNNSVNNYNNNRYDNYGYVPDE